MGFKIAGAPCSWGVEDADNPDNPEWKRVLNEASSAGYKGLELGPYGYLPQEENVVEKVLAENELLIVAGTLYDDLLSTNNFENIIAKTHKTCKLISKLPKPSPIKGQHYPTPYYVIIDSVKEERSRLAGHPDKAPRLNDKKWNQMIEHINEIARITAEEYGIRSVIHPHAGGYIEYADEIDKLVNDISYERAGLCLDTGHLYYDRMEPVQWLKKYSNRLDYIHFKDINQKVYKNVLKKEIDFFDACKENVMCPIGQGIIDYKKIYETLKEIDYNGWITIEQERDPKKSDGALADVKQSREYLSKIGY